MFETHSISEDNELGLASGWTHGPLSEQGRELARGLGARRRDDGIDTVFASDLHRALETAILAFEGETIPILLDWRLRECDYGQLTRQPAVEMHRDRDQYLDDALSRRRELAGGDQPGRTLPRRPPDALGRHARARSSATSRPVGASTTSSRHPARGPRARGLRLAGRLGVRAPLSVLAVRRSRSGVRASGTRRSRRRGARGGSRARARR